MGEISKAVGQWIVGNVGWTVIIALFILSGLFKIAKIEINPLGWVVSWLGNTLTKAVRLDIADLKRDTNEKITALRTDLDGFETATNKSINEMKNGTSLNCELLKTRLDAVEKSNDLQTVRQIKEHVFNFANSCISKRKHTRQDFDNIIKENAEYEELVKKHNLTNEVYDEDYKYILKVYDKCKEENSFLKGED